MEEYEKQRSVQREQERKANKKLPERQFQMFLSGRRPKCYCHTWLYAEYFCRNKSCPLTTGIDIEPLMDRLKQEIIALRQENSVLRAAVASSSSSSSTEAKLQSTNSGNEADAVLSRS